MTKTIIDAPIAHFNTYWQAQVRATLVFLRRPGQLLLIEKKRGLGAGKLTGPGGKCLPDESSLACAKRELNEEVGLIAEHLKAHATLFFAFVDGLRLEVDVYMGTHFHGDLIETDEARPFWIDIAQINYDKMWPDDRFWLPAVLAGHTLEGNFIFDDEHLCCADICIKKPLTAN